jgi:hypothetical protein
VASVETANPGNVAFVRRICAPSAATATTDQTSPARSPALSLQNELRTANHLLTGSLAGIAAGLGGLRLAGCGINSGLRGRSDLETPEAGMMRDQSSVDAAPATLRAEESQPGATSAPTAPSTLIWGNGSTWTS